jgi:hypothetical protein
MSNGRHENISAREGADFNFFTGLQLKPLFSAPQRLSGEQPYPLSLTRATLPIEFAITEIGV